MFLWARGSSQQGKAKHCRALLSPRDLDTQTLLCWLKTTITHSLRKSCFCMYTLYKNTQLPNPELYPEPPSVGPAQAQAGITPDGSCLSSKEQQLQPLAGTDALPGLLLLQNSLLILFLCSPKEHITAPAC